VSILSDRFRKWIRSIAEWFIGDYYEGPQPPRHIAEEARLFRLLNPNAGPSDWESFAVKHAQNCYRSGFVRGFEWTERDWPGPPDDPEVLAELERHDWSLAGADPRLDLALATAANPDDPIAMLHSPAERQAFLDEVAARGGIVTEDGQFVPEQVEVD